MPGAVVTHIYDAVDPRRTPPADSITPVRAAKIAFAGAVADRPKTLTYPDYVAHTRDRFAAVIKELARA